MLQAIQNSLQHHGHDWVIGVIAISAAILLASFLHEIVFRIAARFGRKNPAQSKTVLILQRLRRPALAILTLTAVFFALPILNIPASVAHIVSKTLGVVWMVALGWLMVVTVYVGEEVLLARYDVKASDNLRARTVRTQMMLLRRLVIGLLIIVDVGLILSVFHDSRIWQYGAGLLASAGLASLVLATAAKSTAANILAGIQIAISEPIRLDDVVIVEGEWGRIEEITTAYVMIALWDKRRLVVPLSYFIEKPFQNWTRHSSDLLGTAFLYVDYSVPVEALRAEHSRLLRSTPLWDQQVDSVQVTNLSEKTMEIRCLSSARNASEQFDLRCEVREKMIAFLRENYPDAFPQTRFTGFSPQQIGSPQP